MKKISLILVFVIIIIMLIRMSTSSFTSHTLSQKDVILYKSENVLFLESTEDIYGEIYIKETGLQYKNLLEDGTSKYCDNEDQTIVPVKIVATTAKDNIQVDYGGFLLAVIENNRIVQFIPDSTCGSFSSAKSKLWTFDDYIFRCDTSVTPFLYSFCHIR